MNLNSLKTRAQAKAAALFARLPKPVRNEAEYEAVTFAATFVATAKPLLPTLLGSPSLSTAKAIAAAAIVAAAKATYPLFKAALRRLTAKLPTAPTPPAA